LPLRATGPGPPHRGGQDHPRGPGCLKRHIARELYRTLTATMTTTANTPDAA
jgi:hypothetical protein